jgi:hypothetical protein
MAWYEKPLGIWAVMVAVSAKSANNVLNDFMVSDLI